MEPIATANNWISSAHVFYELPEIIGDPYQVTNLHYFTEEILGSDYKDFVDFVIYNIKHLSGWMVSYKITDFKETNIDQHWIISKVPTESKIKRWFLKSQLDMFEEFNKCFQK